MKATICFVLSLVVVAGLSSCGGGGGSVGNPPPPPKVTVTGVTASCPASVTAGATVKCTATVSKSDGTTDTLVTWSVDNASTATVDATGTVTGVKAGAATVKATSTEDTTKSGTAAVTVNAPPPTLSSILLAGAQSSATEGGTVQLTATGDYSDGSTKDLTASASYAVSPNGFGSVSAAGLFTAPGSAGTATVTASSGGVTSNAFSIAVTQPATAITSITPQVLALDADGSVLFWHVGCTGCQAGDTLDLAPLPSVTLASNADPIALTTIFNAPDFVPGWIDVTDATAKSNTLSMAFIGNVNTVALDASGETYNLERGAAVVHKFKPDMTPDGSFGVSVADHAMAVDPATGDVVTAGAFLDAYSPSGTIVGSNQEVIYSGNGIAAANRIPCMVSTSIVCLPDVAGFTNSVHAALADFSNTVAMTAANGHVTAYAYSRTPSKLCAFDVTPQAVTPGTCATLTGLSTAVNDEFQLAILGTGSSAALLDEAGKTLVFVDLASMTETKRASLQGNPMRIAADATHNDVVAAFADPAARLTRYAKVDPSAGTVTNLSSTSTLLSVGFAVKPDGTKLISCMRDKCEAVNNQ